MEKITGTVKWFSEKRVTPEGGGNDVFVRYTATFGNGYKTLIAGQMVEFDIQESCKGSAANNVIII
ncbi:Cold shock-like protein CspC [Arsenophonus endosymbiont of Aleurodicus floccissimus]|uniref:cold shock domain-containing protein n=1 Tax=Arsenophonus endosymbiont of Aleurodicus floccissimus TaxID=2152761 RepID=UPI000E6AEAF3|nr:cold shock domain-containing protein [Arsenophonus endosymbiont of Aleurodicus floccissimus]SPP31335.1 Cold shock-like protein CspC [Arsenophonus endosymbiont of Aleurodicus floccissimus]